MGDEYCDWANYKGLWHRGCCFFLTTTLCSTLNYIADYIPDDGKCPECGKEIRQVEKRFGREK
jgi:hypothetical protein